jgi:protein transport protein SEC31
VAGALDSGSLGLWDAAKIIDDAANAPISSEKIHTGAIKALQFNPKITNFVATGGEKGELYVTDLNNPGAPIRLGNTAARADDIDCLDWNKKVSNILVTGSSGGFVTVWDMKTKKESLILNNNNRKPASAVAWDPQKPTRLITAVPLQHEPVILVWDLRNSNKPEKVLQGHDSGVLSLSWCAQDSDLLLSSGQDNRTIIWNPQTGVAYGDYPVVTSWTFQTRFNPRNPNFFATASLDGKIQVQSLQNTNPSQTTTEQDQAADGEDFFSRAPNQPQASSFSLEKAPKWLERPTSVAFGFGGRLITVRPADPTKSRASKIDITKFEVDSSVGTATESFEKAIGTGDLTTLCRERIASAKSDEERADWNVIQTLVSTNPRAELVKYLGFDNAAKDDAEVVQTPSTLTVGGEEEKPAVNGATGGRSHKRFNSIWANSADGDFLSELAATKGTKTNNPFQIYTGSESEADRKITQYLILGQFEKALDVCLKEDRISDAFMIAICGGEKCIKKAQEAYFAKQDAGPNYLRLLASVVGKNLWDTVHNADLDNWKEVMATLCTFADEKEFPDLCEALGDRLFEQVSSNATLRKDASFCFLAGSKLEKVISIWIQELKEHEEAGTADADATSAYSLHAHGLQDLIEKVTIFRSVVNFKDMELTKTDDWKLETLYSKYLEYADVVAASGQLEVAQKYLDLLPTAYPGADVARTRIEQATKKKPIAAAASAAAPFAPAATTQSATPSKGRSTARPGYAPSADMFSGAGAAGPTPTPYAAQAPMSYAPPTQPANPYAPLSAAQPAAANPYAPAQPGRGPSMGGPNYGMPQAPGIAPPPRQYNQSPSIPPPSQAKNMTSWNDVPDDFAKPASRSRTPANPAAPPMASPFGPASGLSGIPPPAAPPVANRGKSPLPPPPKAGAPPRVTSPLSGQQAQSFDRPGSASSNPYAPSAPVSSPPVGQNIALPPVGRVSSPYNAPPAAGAPPSNRYAPAPGSQPTPQAPQPGSRPGIAPPPQGSSFTSPPPPSNPYAASQPPPQAKPSPYGPGQTAQPPPPQNQFSAGPPPSQQFTSGPPGGGPPQQLAERPSTGGSEKRAAPPARKHRKSNVSHEDVLCTNSDPAKGDRSHISAVAQPIVDILGQEMARVEARAPSSFKPQVNDTKKRLDLLYDHLNNEDLLKPDTVQQIVDLANSMAAKDYTRAQEIQLDVHQNKVEECGQWMVGVKRLIGMSRATP